MNYNDICVYDDGLLLKKGSDKVYGIIEEDGYIRANIQGTKVRIHRVIWEMFNGPIPEGYVIDHINGNKGDNRISNLRLATQSQNMANSILTKGELPRGVKKKGNRYQARIGFQGKQIHIGSYTTPELASKAYTLKYLELFGSFANLDPKP